MCNDVKSFLKCGKFAEKHTSEFQKELISNDKNSREQRITYPIPMDPQQAVLRVQERVKQGGHSVPEKDIIRRYQAGIKNLIKYYLPLADSALVLDNSSREGVKKLIARKNVEKNLEILDRLIWNKMEEIAHER